MNRLPRMSRVALAAYGAALLLCFTPWGHHGTAGEPARNVATLTAQWWQWVLSIPSPENPLFDETGAAAAVGQPYKGNKVFFLVGVFNESGTAERSITVPEGTSFFFPLLNSIFIDDKGRGRNPENNPRVPELYDIVRADIDSVLGVYVKLNGIDLTEFSERVASPPFAVKVPEDNITGLPAKGFAPGVADGYWFYLAPLPKGEHTLKFGGATPFFTLDITYHITVE